jgi:hypothetical protein
VSPTIGTYSFLPWLRQGIAGQIASTPTSGGRASVPVTLRLSGTPIAGGADLTRDDVGRNVQLYGPGDVVGIDSRAIVRTEPRDWITNFEPNYMPQVEFYDEDFPWRYTPAPPDGSGRLLPWIMLLVLEKDVEFTEGTNVAGKPLPYIDLTSAAKLPDPAGLWAWAHVHVNRTLAGSDDEFTSIDMNAVLPRLQAVLDESPDLAYSRIVCPRRLDENKAYHAFLVPAFETGRLAGLGLDPTQTTQPATKCAWESYTGKPSASSLPVYHRWYFRTGTQGDFEFLVRLLKPQPVDPRVGVRDVDVQAPGSNVPGITDPALGGVLKLGGALRVPGSVDQDWAQPYPHPFQTALAALVNLADDYAARRAPDANAAAAANGLDPAVAADPDPLITAPIYGRWHALTQRLLEDRAGAPVSPNDNWVHDLNLDPRHRLAAGFGTRVVQSKQEDYMKAAWDQVGEVLEANRRIREAQLAKLVGSSLYVRDLQPLVTTRPERALTMTAPVHKHVLASPVTVHHHLKQSLVPPVLTSAAMRRVSRPRGRLMRALPFDDGVRPDNLLTRVNRGEVSAAPPKRTPPGVVTTDQVADVLLPAGPPPWLVALLRRKPWLVLVALLLAILLVVLVLVLVLAGAGAGLLAAGAVVAAALVALWWALRRWQRAIAQSDVVRPSGLTVEAVDALPKVPDFVISEPGAGVTPTPGAQDSPQAARFKDALRDWHRLYQASVFTGSEVPPIRLQLVPLAGTVIGAIDPDVTVPRRILSILVLPGVFVVDLDERFQEVMAYPKLDVPMYEPLTELSADLFLPNLHLVPQNSITLLETNQKFIEAYMVGVNHEFASELLWREYPTDQRGSYFRQFWDPRPTLQSANLTPEQQKEALYDIPKLHGWPPGSDLGEHDNRELEGEAEEELVLVIRGELLKKYPNAVIYAQKAAWQITAGKIDPGKERELVPLTEEEEAAPPHAKLRTPLYEARVDPDITFFGFDLTLDEARGDSGDNQNDRPGWFFVIKERPGEPRFGLDIDRAPQDQIQTVNDLAWKDAIPGGGPGDFVQATALGTITLEPLGPADVEKQEQRKDDLRVVAGPAPAAVSAARWAYILYQAPVIVAVHASEMLDGAGG